MIARRNSLRRHWRDEVAIAAHVRRARGCAHAAAKSGLTPDDVVLTSGLNQVRPGQAIRTGGAFDPTQVRPASTAPEGRAYQTAD